jgi:hypothetical protein
MVNLMFGANAPRLCKMILDELAKETAVIKKEAERVTVKYFNFSFNYYLLL